MSGLSMIVAGQDVIKWNEIGQIAPRHAKEIRSSNWSVGAEMLDRDWTIYENWKSYLGPLGAKKARIQSGWAKTEKAIGIYDFTWLDVVIHDMNAQGVRPWISLSYGNPLYPEGGGTSLNAAVPKSETAMTGWKNYVKTIVVRYKNVVDEWEVWNEPNYRIAPEDYANLFIATAEIIRTEHPKATIIAFAIGSGVDYKYVDKVMEIIQEKEKIHLIDQITHHRHIFIPENNEPELALEKVVAKYNPAIKIRQGEGGCPSQRNEGYALNKYDWTETSQAKHISRRLLSDLGRDKESSCFTIMESRSTEEWNYKGLLKANPDSTVAYAKPAYRAFQHITSIFDDQLVRIQQYPYSFEAESDTNISLYAYKNKENKQVVTIWLNDKIPSDNNHMTLKNFVFHDGQFVQPVWVDVVSGQVYEIPESHWSKNGTRYDFKQIPIYDSPVLIADLSVLKIHNNRTTLQNSVDFPDLIPPANMTNVDAFFEDVQFKDQGRTFFTSKTVDFIRIRSTVSDDVEFAIVIYKPEQPSPILLLSHGWHMSVMPPENDTSNPYPDFLTVQVDMRGRQYSTGKPDCNGWELYDFYDTYLFLVEHYKQYISDPSQVYYMGGSGGGGNGFAIIGKFPDLFCSASIACGISDYALWFEQDTVGEFRDDMLPWIGCTPGQNAEAYRSRSGITTVQNILTPAYIVHGETDIRVPVNHSRNYVEKARKHRKNVHYLELMQVGTRDHWGRITPEQETQKKEIEKSALKYHPAPQLPPKGELVVAGYVVTKHFSVFMDSIDSVGKIKYNLKKRKISFIAGSGEVVWKNEMLLNQ